MHRTFLLLCVWCGCLAGVRAHAQQTVFNVPSADVLDRGKAYLELDVAVSESAPSAAFTPRFVYGLGHNIEVGVNVPSFDTSDAGTVSLAPVIKWKFYENKQRKLMLFAGDHVFLPVHHRTFNAGNYAYLELAKEFATRTRVGIGAYDFSAKVVARGNRAGIQASIEQNVTKRLKAAADWYSGNNSVGYVTPGIIYQLNKAVTLYGAYEIGNADLTHGKHAVLFEIGWNPN